MSKVFPRGARTVAHVVMLQKRMINAAMAMQEKYGLAFATTEMIMRWGEWRDGVAIILRDGTLIPAPRPH